MRAGGWISGHQPFRRGPLCRARRHARFDLSRRLATDCLTSRPNRRCRRFRWSQLQAAAQSALDRVIAVRGRSELEAALRAVDDLAAAQLARGLREMGVTPSVPFDAATLRVATPMRPVFRAVDGWSR